MKKLEKNLCKSCYKETREEAAMKDLFWIITKFMVSIKSIVIRWPKHSQSTNADRDSRKKLFLTFLKSAS